MYVQFTSCAHGEKLNNPGCKIYVDYFGRSKNNLNERLYAALFNPNIGGLFRVSLYGGRRQNYPCLKLVKILLEIRDFARKYSQIFSFRKCTFKYQDPLNFADIFFLAKNSIFGKNSTFTQSNSMRSVL